MLRLGRNAPSNIVNVITLLRRTALTLRRFKIAGLTVRTMLARRPSKADTEFESEEGLSVSCPGLPGCWSQGKTEEDAFENIQSAIREYLEAAVKISTGASYELRTVPVSI